MMDFGTNRASAERNEFKIGVMVHVKMAEQTWHP